MNINRFFTVNSIFKFFLQIRIDFMNFIVKQIFERKKITRLAITYTIYFSMKNNSLKINVTNNNIINEIMKKLSIVQFSSLFLPNIRRITYRIYHFFILFYVGVGKKDGLTHSLRE